VASAIQTVVGGTIRTRFDIYRTTEITAADGRVWKAMRDGSLHCLSGKSAEIVSPICTYEDIETVQAVVRAVKAAGAKVNYTCGIHVHVGVPNITGR
jgi:hypothetical protein